MDWTRLERQLAALGEAVADAARGSAEDVERTRRSLQRIEALERLLATAPPAASEPAQVQRPTRPTAVGDADEVSVEAEPAAPRPRRASLHSSPLADLFRDSELTPRPD